MNCSQYDLKAYWLDELAESERRPVEEHLQGCIDCREELERLRLTESALRNLADEEIPRKIAFVSDKVFEPKGWGWLWNSGPRLGFASSLVLAAAILAHALVRPAPSASAAEMAALESRLRAEVTRSVEVQLAPVAESFEMLQKRATVSYRDSLYVGSRQ